MNKIDQAIWKRLEKFRDECSVKVEELRMKREEGSYEHDVIHEHGIHIGKRDGIELAMVLFASMKLENVHQLQQTITTSLKREILLKKYLDETKSTTSLIRTLSMSKAHKIKHGWTREGGAGFIFADLLSVKKNLDGTITVETPSFTLTEKIIEFNLRETEEMLRFVRIRRIEKIKGELK